MINIKMVTLRMPKDLVYFSKKERIEGSVTFENMVNLAIEHIESEFLSEVVDIKYEFDSSEKNFQVYTAMILYKSHN